MLLPTNNACRLLAMPTLTLSLPRICTSPPSFTFVLWNINTDLQGPFLPLAKRHHVGLPWKFIGRILWDWGSNTTLVEVDKIVADLVSPYHCSCFPKNPRLSSVGKTMLVLTERVLNWLRICFWLGVALQLQENNAMHLRSLYMDPISVLWHRNPSFYLKH